MHERSCRFGVGGTLSAILAETMGPMTQVPEWIGAPPQSATKQAAALRDAFEQAQLGYTMNKTQGAGTFSFAPTPDVATLVH